MAPMSSLVVTLPSSERTSTMPFSKFAFECSTPESLFSSPSTAALQWPQLMSGTLKVVSSITPLSLDFQQPLDGGGELLDLLVGALALLDRFPDAVLDVIVQQEEPYLLGGGDYAPDLGEDVYAVGLLVHHPLHAPHLSLDPPQAVLELLLVLRLDVAVDGVLYRLLVCSCGVHLSAFL